MSDVEEDAKFEVDLYNTVASNIFTILLLFLIGMYIKVFAVALNLFETPELKLLALILFTFSSLKLFGYFCGEIKIHYKERKYITKEQADEHDE